ncbi:MAG: hypothetical protein ABJH08_13425 [Balneola sp.]
MRLILLFGFLLLMCSSGFSQDRILLTNGEVLMGKVDIRVSRIRDRAKLNRAEVTLSEIDTIFLESGEVYKPKRVTYYFELGRSEEYRDVILKEVLKGPANLYSYSGVEFNFVLEVNERTIALQSLPEGTNLETMRGFKEDISILLGSCVSEERVKKLRLTRDKFLSIVNEYNECKDSSYVPLVSPEKKDHILVYELSAGIHAAQHSLAAPFFRFNSSRPVKVGDINQENVSTIGWVVNFSFQKNLFNSKNLFFYSAVALRKFSFQVTSEDVNSGLSNFEFIEGNYLLGLHYQKEVFDKLSLGVSSGLLAWTTKIQDNVFYNSGRYPVIPDYSAKLSGVGLFAQGGFYYELNTKTSLFTNVRGNFRNGNNLFSQDPVRIETSTYQNDDALQDLFTVMVGVRLNTFRTNY